MFYVILNAGCSFKSYMTQKSSSITHHALRTPFKVILKHTFVSKIL